MRLVGLPLAVLATIGAAACSSGASTSASTSSGATPAPTEAPSTTTVPTSPYYVSLGDSYAAGYEAGIGTTRNGFAYQVVDEAGAAAHPLELVNLGCGGATTTSILEDDGCPPGGLGPGATPYEDQTQIEAAEEFLRAHPGQVGLITVSIGGNDVTKCSGATDPVTCVTDAVADISTNVAALLARVRAAAGPDVLIVGTTYPDVILGDWVNGAPNGEQLASLSIVAFRDLINPALQRAYEAAGGEFVDVTAATGAYGSMQELTDVAPYGSIPVPVARVCELTTYCTKSDIHPTPAGYRVIADLVVDAYLSSEPAGG